MTQYTSRRPRKPPPYDYRKRISKPSMPAPPLPAEDLPSAATPHESTAVVTSPLAVADDGLAYDDFDDSPQNLARRPRHEREQKREQELRKQQRTQLDKYRQVWTEYAERFAAWTMLRMVNRRDVWGRYLPLHSRDGKQKAITMPPLADRGRTTFRHDDLVAHYRGEQVQHLIGLHSTSPQNTCKWIAWDIDRHDDDPNPPDADENLQDALRLHDALTQLGLHPLLTESNGDGGYHLRVILDPPICAGDAYAFAKMIAALAPGKTIETSPKQPKLTGREYGNWLRLPGRHHTRCQYSRVYGDGQWLEGAEAIERFLATRGDDADIVRNAVKAMPHQMPEPTRANAVVHVRHTLNPQLFSQLERKFGRGRVKIVNPGESRQSQLIKHLITGQEREVTSHGGEEYQVCCDCCSDDRYRLYVNHAFGTRDPTGRRRFWGVHCHNEDCYSDYEARRILWDELMALPDNRQRPEARILPGRTITPEERPPRLPVLIPLHALPREHPANTYLAGRGYGPERLSRRYGVGYCPAGYRDPELWMARNRIVAPVCLDGKLRGWQARFIGERDWKAEGLLKWVTLRDMPKSKLLYNYDVARRFHTGVVVEGMGDVWSFGTMAVAIFGSKVSQHQAALLRRGFVGRPLVLLLDPDVQHDPRKKQGYDQTLAQLRRPDAQFAGVASVVLPDGTDPGSQDGRWLHEFVRREARGQGGQD